MLEVDGLCSWSVKDEDIYIVSKLIQSVLKAFANDASMTICGNWLQYDIPIQSHERVCIKVQ